MSWFIKVSAISVQHWTRTLIQSNQFLWINQVSVMIICILPMQDNLRTCLKTLCKLDNHKRSLPTSWRLRRFSDIICVCENSVLSNFATPRTIAHYAPLSMEFSRQEYWSGLPFPTPGDLPDPRIKFMSLVSSALVDRSFTSSITKLQFCL